MRIFAGPNGSGKSTIVNKVRKYKVNGTSIDFGIYVNADDIANSLRKESLPFNRYQVKLTKQEFIKLALDSGLVNKTFNTREFKSSFLIKDNKIYLNKSGADERLAQIVAHVLRKKLLSERKKFSFETVFSHESKIDIMREAIDAGYKVYFYFISTKSPKINEYRVKVRVEKGGHDVPQDKINSRYFRSMDLLYEASKYAYRAFYFDNSKDGEGDNALFAHFKVDKEGRKDWDVNEEHVPDWFKKYYSGKV